MTDFISPQQMAERSRGTAAIFAANPEVAEQPEMATQGEPYGTGGPSVYGSQGGSSGGTYYGYPTNRYEVTGHYHP